MFDKWLKWIKSNQKSADVPPVLKENIPNHIAIIMDGNGRWAKKRGLPRIAGHREGMNVVKAITRAAADLGVGVLTLYAFSTENWKRPKQEVDFLMKLPEEYLLSELNELVQNNIRVQMMGNSQGLPDYTLSAITKAILLLLKKNNLFLR